MRLLATPCGAVVCCTRAFALCPCLVCNTATQSCCGARALLRIKPHSTGWWRACRPWRLLPLMASCIHPNRQSRSGCSLEPPWRRGHQLALLLQWPWTVAVPAQPNPYGLSTCAAAGSRSAAACLGAVRHHCRMLGAAGVARAQAAVALPGGLVMFCGGFGGWVGGQVKVSLIGAPATRAVLDRRCWVAPSWQAYRGAQLRTSQCVQQRGVWCGVCSRMLVPKQQHRRPSGGWAGHMAVAVCRAM